MAKLPNMLTAVVHSTPSRDTIRKMILLEDRQSYKLCASALKQQGIVPVKQVEAANMLCCHFDNSKPLCSLIQHPSIRRIETDIRAKIHDISHKRRSAAIRESKAAARIPWGLKDIHAPEAWGESRGQGIKIGIIDTGISRHNDLVIAGGYNTIRRNHSYEDDNGHGTHVAGIAAAAGRMNMPFGVAPKVSLYGVKALDKRGDGFLSDIIEGVEWCIANGMNIINMSLGLDGPSHLLRASIYKAYQQGIIVIASAGNSGPNNLTIEEPAIYPEVIAVAATDRKKQIPSFSSRGYGIDVSAPGNRIVSTNHKQGFSVDSGTSMAAPHVSGTVALILAVNPTITPDEVRELLRSTAHRLPDISEYAQGAGIIDAKQAVQAADFSASSDKRRRKAIPAHNPNTASTAKAAAAQVSQRRSRVYYASTPNALIKPSTGRKLRRKR
ncbi:S8 family peptidase [Paenibacillus marinisediminis]